MLPTVSQVLQKFLSPIAEIARSSSVSTTLVSQRDSTKGGHQHNQQDSHENHHSEEEPHPATSGSNASKSPPHLKLVENIPPPPPKLDDLPSILQIFSLIRNHREKMQRWFGLKTYRTTAREQRKSTQIVKGAILDEKIS